MGGGAAALSGVVDSTGGEARLGAAGGSVGEHVADQVGSYSLRVCSWTLKPRWVRAADRYGFNPDTRANTLGFRLAQD